MIRNWLYRYVSWKYEGLITHNYYMISRQFTDVAPGIVPGSQNPASGEVLLTDPTSFSITVDKQVCFYI